MVNLPAEQIGELKQLFPTGVEMEEGGTPFFFIPNYQLPLHCTPSRTDLLFCPVPFGGYSSRVYFATMIQGIPARNWNSKGVRIVDRTWWAFSWRVTGDLRPSQLLLAHLGALS